MNSLIRALSFITKYSSSLVVIVLCCTLPTQAKDHPQKDTKNILFIAGDTKHRHGFHEYKAGSILLADALNKSGLSLFRLKSTGTDGRKMKLSLMMSMPALSMQTAEESLAKSMHS